MKNLTISQIYAIKYDGAKESQTHKDIKNLIEESLRADSNFKCIDQETRVYGDDGSYRKPDVQAKYNDQLVAFEVQLSTTFLSVIVERSEHYRKNEVLFFGFLTILIQTTQS